MSHTSEKPDGEPPERAARDFQVFAKPGGATCNLDCRYCYYLDKALLYAEAEPFRMSEPLLETYIVQHIRASQGPTVAFSWHGGEPTTLGLDYFRTIVALQERHRPVGWRVTNGMQTNGLLLDEAWCRFLAAQHFSVGISLDGPASMHNRYRLTKGQRPSFGETMRGFGLLQQFKIPTDVLCVVNDYNVQFPIQVYRFFREIGARFLGFLPLVEPISNGEVSHRTVPAEAFGTFLCTIFDEWRRRDVGRMAVQIFEEAGRPARRLEHSLCVFRPTCGDIPVVEHNGDFFPCDHFVEARHRLGNILETPLVRLLESPPQRAFGDAKRDTLPQYCRACDVRPMCNGGCPKDRVLRTPDGESGLNYLCAGYKRFFRHVLPFVEVSAPGPSPQERERLQAMSRAAARRNDPCPCGSGLKYKRCCLVR